MSGAKAVQSSGRPYAGDVPAAEAWSRLGENPSGQLVDVRTDAEWGYVGIPDLTALARAPLLVAWQTYPDGQRNPNFVAEVEAGLRQVGYEPGAPLYFLCRSGARSRAAAIAMTASGHEPCFNVGDGFEGNLDGDRHRGRSEGWKASGLPWVQS